MGVYDDEIFCKMVDFFILSDMKLNEWLCFIYWKKNVLRLQMMGFLENLLNLAIKVLGNFGGWCLQLIMMDHLLKTKVC